MKQKITTLLVISIFIMFFSLNKNQSFSQVIDFDSNKYKTVIIGTQEWMAENLSVEHYRNGDVIPHVQDSADWVNLTTGAWCYYVKKSENIKTYGKLYNWYAVNDSRGLAPEGWHIPNNIEWSILIEFLGGNKVAGKKLKSKNGWYDEGNGTNNSGFSAFPGGYRSNHGVFQLLGKYGYFWSSSEDEENEDLAWNRFLSYDYSDVYRYYNSKKDGVSVRCVRN